MRRITINGKEYTIEFSIAASLYNECTEEIMNGFVDAGISQSDAEAGHIEDAMKKFISTMANVPQKATTLFYAGLLEHHGAEYGDGSIKSPRDAVELMRVYIKENGKSMLDIMNDMFEIIGEDNFFEMIGLDKMMEQTEPKKRKRSGKAGETSSKTE